MLLYSGWTDFSKYIFVYFFSKIVQDGEKGGGCMFEQDQLNNVGDMFQPWLNEILLGEEAGSPRVP